MSFCATGTEYLTEKMNFLVLYPAGNFVAFHYLSLSLSLSRPIHFLLKIKPESSSLKVVKCACLSVYLPCTNSCSLLYAGPNKLKLCRYLNLILDSGLTLA